MRGRLTLGISAALALLLACADELVALDYKGLASVRQMRAERRFDEANTLLASMIAAAKDSEERDSYTIIAVEIADRNLEDVKRAWKLTEEIVDSGRRDFTRLQMLERHDKRTEALALAKARNEANASWPADCRGAAFRILGDIHLAENDEMAALALFKEAAITPATSIVDRGRSAQKAAAIHLAMGNRTESEAMLRQGLAITSAYYAWRCETMITLCQLLAEDKRPAAIIEVLEPVDFKEVRNTWKTTLLKFYYQALLDDGQTIEAIKTLDRALLDPETPKASKAWIEDALDKIAEAM